MFVGGGNHREDFHINEGEELFYQLKGRVSTVKIIFVSFGVIMKEHIELSMVAGFESILTKKKFKKNRFLV